MVSSFKPAARGVVALFHSLVSFRFVQLSGGGVPIMDYKTQRAAVYDAPRRRGILISECNLSFLPHHIVFFYFILLNYEANKIALIWPI